MYFPSTLSSQLLWAAHIISVFRAAATIIAGDGGNGGRFLTCVAWKSRWLKKKKGKKGVIVQQLCVIGWQPTWGAALCVYCFCPVRVTPAPLSSWPPPSLCLLQPIAATLIIWRLRWASPILWWRPSAGCCCSPWAKRVGPHWGHGMPKKVWNIKGAAHSSHFHSFKLLHGWKCKRPFIVTLCCLCDKRKWISI